MVRNRRLQPVGIDGIRGILKQLFVLAAVGSLFVFVPLHSKALRTNEAPSKIKSFRTGERESTQEVTASERLALWLDQIGLSKGQGDTN